MKNIISYIQEMATENASLAKHKEVNSLVGLVLQLHNSTTKGQLASCWILF